MTPYDKWRLSAPEDDRHEIGSHEGETCGRYDEPDEDEPRGYRPKPCEGVMADDVCDTCGATP